MCGRFTLSASGEELARQFDLEEAIELEPRFNIAPSQDVATVRQEPGGTRTLYLQRWGLIPAWVKDPKEFTTLINARSETVAEKPAFRSAGMTSRHIHPGSSSPCTSITSRSRITGRSHS